MGKEVIETALAPRAIGTYSQAVKVGRTVYISGQIPLDPQTMELVSGDIKPQITQVFANLQAVVRASGASFNEVVKMTVYLTDLSHFPLVNEVMAEVFSAPYPARAVVGVVSLPRNSQVEIEAIVEVK